MPVMTSLLSRRHFIASSDHFRGVSMSDPFWDAACRSVWPLLSSADTVLVPRGAWPTHGGRLVHYHGQIEPEEATVLILHKSKLSAIRKRDLERVWRQWQCVFANEVFVCFTRDRRLWIDRRLTSEGRFTRGVWLYLRSSAHKRRAGTAFMVHLPKAGGTSLWAALKRHVRSCVYYDCIEAFVFNPPLPGEFDLVCGHIPIHFILPHLQARDHLTAVLRHPTARFRAAFLHSRRADESSDTFSPTMRRMRETALSEFLCTSDAMMEMRQQMVMLGFGFDRDYCPALDYATVREALARMSRPNTHFFSLERLDSYTTHLSHLFALPRLHVERQNSSDLHRQAHDVAEFRALTDEIEHHNKPERDLYDFVSGASK